MLRSRLVALLVAAAILAGCSGAPAPSADADAVDFDDIALSAGAGRGVVRGVVVDTSLRPLEGANVTLAASAGPRNALTDGEGRFGFSDVEPGLTTVQASKAGYTTVQTTVEVVAGVTEPKAIAIGLERLPGSDPYVVPLLWHGYLQCSWTLGGAFATGCLIGDFTDDFSRAYDPIDKTPAFLQSELVWSSTQTLGTNLCMRHYASEDIGGEILMDDVCGPSPLMQQANGTRLDETKVGAGLGIERAVWVAGYGHELAPGFAFNQQVDVYTHLFYNLEPDPAWRFATDGPYPIPGA